MAGTSFGQGREVNGDSHHFPTNLLRIYVPGPKIVAVPIYPFGGVVPEARGARHAMVADLKAKVFPTEPVKMVAIVEGRKEVRNLG